MLSVIFRSSILCCHCTSNVLVCQYLLSLVAGVGEAGIPASNLLQRSVVRLCGVAHSSPRQVYDRVSPQIDPVGTAAVVPRTRCHTVDPPRPRADFMKQGMESAALSRFIFRL